MWLKWESGHIGHKIKKGEMELQGRRKSRSQKQHMSSESGLAHSPDEISLMEEKKHLQWAPRVLICRTIIYRTPWYKPFWRKTNMSPGRVKYFIIKVFILFPTEFPFDWYVTLCLYYFSNKFGPLETGHLLDTGLLSFITFECIFSKALQLWFFGQTGSLW